MLVPRSYLYSSPQSILSSTENCTTPMPISKADRNTSKAFRQNNISVLSAKPITMPHPPPAMNSKPVTIPTRIQNSKRCESRDCKYWERIASTPTSRPHEPSSTPMSVPAPLAVSPLWKSQCRPNSNNLRQEFDLSHAAKDAISIGGKKRQSISSSSPHSWGTLLNPPEEDHQESYSDNALGPLWSVRSASTESMPSLDTDIDSLSSNSSPATPGSITARHYSGDRRQKIFSLSKGEDCHFDHPLLQKPWTKDVGTSQGYEELQRCVSPSPRATNKSKIPFKSNLTASLRALRSAAISFAEVHTPNIQRDNFLPRSLLSNSPQCTDDRRPLPSANLPDPALRRYLNPVCFSPSEFHSHQYRENVLSSHSRCTASIQLQTYLQSPQLSEKATSPPIFVFQQPALVNENLGGLSEGAKTFLPRQREPRENSDFLRVIVLEMNMRKQGKLSNTCPGKARLWLPPREAAKLIRAELVGRTDIPKRWSATIA